MAVFIWDFWCGSDFWQTFRKTLAIPVPSNTFSANHRRATLCPVPYLMHRAQNTVQPVPLPLCSMKTNLCLKQQAVLSSELLLRGTRHSSSLTEAPCSRPTSTKQKYSGSSSLILDWRYPYFIWSLFSSFATHMKSLLIGNPGVWSWREMFLSLFLMLCSYCLCSDIWRLL